MGSKGDAEKQGREDQVQLLWLEVQSASSASKSGDPVLPCDYYKVIYNYFSCDFSLLFLQLVSFFFFSRHVF